MGPLRNALRGLGIALSQTLGQVDSAPSSFRHTGGVGAILGENPVWDAKGEVLYWIDIPQGRLHAYWPSTRRATVWSLASELSAIALRQSGGLIVAIGQDLMAFDPESGSTEPLASIPGLAPGVRLNDCACDASGDLWIGSMDRACREPLGCLYRVTPAGAVFVVDTGLTISNGPAIDEGRRRWYVADTMRREIRVLSIDADGRCIERAIFARLDEHEGLPDGMTVDAEGCLWVAHYGGARISRWSPGGQRTATFGVPAANVTSLAFGGDDLGMLFVTTAAPDHGSGASPPGTSGGLLIGSVGVKGSVPGRFGG